MALLKILIFPDPRLRIVAEPIRSVDASIKKLADDMLETMYEGSGIGLAATRLDVNKRVKKLMEVSKVSFATAEEMKELTGMEVGGVTVFALPGTLPIYVDERIMELDWVILGGGGRDTKIKTAPAIFKMLKANIIKDLANPL